MCLETISQIYHENDELKITEKTLGFFEVIKGESCQISCSYRNSQEHIFILDGGWRGLIAFDPMSVKIIKGEINLFKINLMKLAKLQVFIDYATDNIETDYIMDSCSISFSKEIKQINPEVMECWLLQQAMLPEDEADPIVSFLRHTECYGLVHFLLSAANDNNQCLQQLCLRYGLSAAHFRRLTRHALGHTTKVTLREWRMTKAILAFINDPKNMTDVAFAHGYSSLSHFSNDVKKMLGMTPRALRKSILDVAMK
ncbi:helix-turn-helix domain-containing protein [Rouxiella sp. WC2420]|uniref:Helix-turn-helix domain-containing protein n=1 Tax=Rouxiella sp. WC2420 TaxID=3234145 RepID=A0AB39VJV8_9GAMM